MPGIDADPEFTALKRLSARAGADPLLVQGAGGNTSIKRDGVLWVKASGTWLMHAERDAIFVPVTLEPLVAAFRRDDGSAEKGQDFVPASLNPSGLRPSIETTFHALIPQAVVVHVHCVGTIAHAVRRDGQSILAGKLAGLEWAYVSYFKPGVDLTRGIVAVMRPETRVFVLANHGLIVCGDTVAEAEALLDEVHRRLTDAPREAEADPGWLVEKTGGPDWVLPDFFESHAAAADKVSVGFAAGGSLYPDHVIFLGVGSAIAGEGETAADVEARVAASGLPAPVSVLFPGKGVLMHRTANAGAQAMARCLADVTARIPADAPVTYLNDGENAELLDWDAEKYRQEMNRKRAGAGG